MRGQQEVDTQGSTAQGHVDDAVDELRNLFRQGGELVHDEQQRRRSLRVPHPLQFDEVLRPGPVEDPLAVAEFGVQRHERPPHLACVEIGDQPDDVGEVDAVLERRAALVVDQQERDPTGAVGGCQGGHVALQQFRLSGPGRARHEGVRAVDADVDRQRRIGLVPDRHPQLQARPGGQLVLTLLPAVGHGARIIQDLRATEQIHQRRGSRNRSLATLSPADFDYGGERPREVLCLLAAEILDGHRADLLATLAEAERAVTGPGLEVDYRCTVPWQAAPHRTDPDEVNAHRRPLLKQRRQSRAVQGRALVDEHGRWPALAVAHP